MEAVFSLRAGHQVLVCLVFLVVTWLDRKRGARRLVAVLYPHYRGNVLDKQCLLSCGQ